MYLLILNKRIGIDAIDFVGDQLTAYVYDADGPAGQESVAVPFISKKQIDQFMTEQGRQLEELEDFTDRDYAFWFNKQLTNAILEKFPSFLPDVKRALYVTVLLFGLAHTALVFIWLQGLWFVAIPVYFCLMMYTYHFAKRKNLYN